MTRLFGTNGVRGVVNQELTVQLAADLARATGSWVPAGSIVAVARDARTSGPMLEAAAVAGLLSAGVRVVRLGVCATPAVQYYVKNHAEVRAGVVITASHNPPEFNGIKLVADDGTETSRDEEEAVEALYFARRFRQVPFDKLQPLADDPGATPAYVRGILQRVDVAAVRKRRFRVVLDAGGGPGSLATLPLLRELGCDVTPLFCELDGLFRGRKSEPVEENLSALREAVRTRKADLGIAHDGDADRCIFVDENGAWVSGDASLALLARWELRASPGLVCTPVSTSSLLEDVVKQAGGRVMTTAVGSPIVARAMMRDHAVYGGEENGGIIFPRHQYCRDGAMTAAKMLELLAAEPQPLSRLVSSLPQYHVTKAKFRVPDDVKARLLEQMSAWTQDEFPGAKVDRTDGLKIYMEGGWVLIRASGTEPIVRVFAESRDPAWSKTAAQRFVEKGTALAHAAA